MKPSPSWYLATLNVKTCDVDTALLAFHELGSLGCEEKNISDELVSIKSYFEGTQKKESLQTQLEESLNAYSVSFELESLEAFSFNLNDQSWRQHFNPFLLIPGLVIAPTWEKYQAKENEQILFLNPGTAFGTGLHDTTRFCAEALHRYAHENMPKSVLDLGCGSGILSFVAQKLGYTPVVGVDIDPEALRVTEENAEENKMEAPLLYSSLDEVSQEFDVVVANILLNTLNFLAEKIDQRVARNGILILSGILPEQESQIRKRFEALHFKKIHLDIGNEWACLHMKKEN
ncbi:MAG: 50S ribosomal protein L11 methyltransferase [Deltaproteobacteria bacterium CG_4_10_14_0_2_um_filter_43_8]|nr:MAG: 50S ribosomal protein L11 methyltransferase [Deltaproteobacteria bacterium CG11_big_fil_rev_8_21_14_0_20_42_23]PJA20619.1 MAG: 50S ribosomal protein L11 methyltransferase [Deltaproteobacteria bacterium CG_4_10_14_0_2_um_filter_43_8]PJC65225.1 MAG: 50S ribosomal protein L11 methyltransferase [Deltaproteobacteria bacterium CG_4_9_14_0_2_um_filter_42_21]